MTVLGKKSYTNKLWGQDKGHREEVRQFIYSIKNGIPIPNSISEKSILHPNLHLML